MRRLWLVAVGVLVGIAGCREEAREQEPEACLPLELKQHFAGLKPVEPGTVHLETMRNTAAIERFAHDAGGSFGARDGDFLLSNGKVRAVLQQPSRQYFIGNFGGTLIDVDVERPDGSWHDVLGEITPLIGLSYAVDVQQIRTLRDGSDGVLVVQASGPVAILDWLNLQGGLDAAASGLVGDDSQLQLKAPWDMNRGIPMVATHYYVLRAGASHIEFHTAMCSSSDQPQLTVFTDMLDSGGNVSAFNTAGLIEGDPGFGTQLSLTSVAQKAGVVGYTDFTSGYGLRGHDAASVLAYAGLGFFLHGTEDGVGVLLDLLMGVDPARPPQGFLRLPAHGSAVISRDVMIFDRYDAMVGELRALEQREATATLDIRVSRAAGAGDIAVAVLNDQGLLETYGRTDSSGRLALTVPPGRYTVEVDPSGGLGVAGQQVVVAGGQRAQLAVALPAPARVRFDIRGVDDRLAAGEIRMPAKVSFVCQGECPLRERRMFTDVLYDHFPEGVQLQAYVDAAGHASVMAKRGQAGVETLAIPPGRYELVISRGITYDLHREVLELSAGQTTTVTATLSRVVDLPGYVSADLHVHTVNSMDSPIPGQDRVLTFAGEGVDLLVATDHDYITDLQPAIRAAGLEKYLSSMIGEELTFFDLGHFNAYPLKLDASAVQGGAFDPGLGEGRKMVPQDMFAGLRILGAVDKPVVQVNHGRSLLFGYFAAIGLNTDTLTTTVDPLRFRMDPADAEPHRLGEADTGLFSTDFDAFEVYNIYGEIAAGLNDLFAFLNLGLRKTGVAVSDTHSWYSSAAGMPRSFVYVGSASDTPASLDQTAFTRAVQAGRVMGTNGPLLELNVKSQADGSVARLGELADGRDGVEATVRVRMPQWMHLDTVELFYNTPNVASHSGAAVNTYPQAQYSREVTAGDFTAAGGAMTLELTTSLHPDRDLWLVAVARDATGVGEDGSLFPVNDKADERAFAYTNAVFVDADGNGRFDAPGLRGQIQQGGGTVPEMAVQSGASDARARKLQLLEKLEHEH